MIRSKLRSALMVSVLKTVYLSLRFHGVIVVFRGTRIRLERGAGIKLDPKASLFLGTSPLGTPLSLTIRRGGRLSIHGQVKFSSASRLLVGKNAHLEIGDQTFFHHNNVIECWDYIAIGSECGISWDVHIMDGNAHELIVGGKRIAATRPTHIGDRVWIGSRVSVVGATIGDGSMLGAGSVVSSSVPPKSLARGNPARVVCEDISFVPHRFS